MNKINEYSKEHPKFTLGILGVLLVGLIVAITALVPVPLYDDWWIFRTASLALMNGEHIYGLDDWFYFGYVFNPPWVFVALLPFAILPHYVGVGLMSSTTLIVTAALCYRYDFNLRKTVLVIFSPVVFYTLMHAQLDLFILLGIFLPMSLWPILAISKPQLTIALGLKTLNKEHFLKAFVVSSAIFIVSLLIWGPWVIDVIILPKAVDQWNNLWKSVWPVNFPIGVALVAMGWQMTQDIKRKKEENPEEKINDKMDELYYLAGSAFLFTYAAISNMIGVWLLLFSKLKDWQAVVVWLASWAMVIYHYTVITPLPFK